MVRREVPTDAGLRLSFCTFVCLLLACQTPPPNTSQKDSDEIDVESKKVVDPLKVAAANKVFRQVDVSKKAHQGVVYGNYSLGSGAIRSQRELEAFLARLQTGKPVYSAPNLQSALTELGIDFEHEALLLLRHTEAMSVERHVGAPSLALSTTPEVGRARKTLTLTIEDPRPAMMANVPQTEAQYCFPVVVDTSQVDMAVFEVEGNVVFAVDFDGASPQFEEQGGRK